MLSQRLLTVRLSLLCGECSLLRSRLVVHEPNICGSIGKSQSLRPQWLIIHGREVGKLLAPLLVFATRRDGFGEQQPQPGPCEALY